MIVSGRYCSISGREEAIGRVVDNDRHDRRTAAHVRGLVESRAEKRTIWNDAEQEAARRESRRFQDECIARERPLGRNTPFGIIQLKVMPAAR